MFIVVGIILIVYLACPIAGKIVLLIANTFIPDPIPFVDEFIMVVGLLTNIVRVGKIGTFITEHKVLCFFGLIFAVLCIVAII